MTIQKQLEKTREEFKEKFRGEFSCPCQPEPPYPHLKSLHIEPNTTLEDIESFLSPFLRSAQLEMLATAREQFKQIVNEVLDDLVARLKESQ